VWVSKLGFADRPRNILIASDLSPLSDSAVALGLAMGRLAGAQIDLLDVVNYPLDRHWIADPANRLTQEYHAQVCAQATQALRAQLERNDGPAATSSVAVHVVEGDGTPDHAILSFIREHRIDLLVLGTAARHGLSGLLYGNTAERLLPDVPCSVLAVRQTESVPGQVAETAPAV
jgi:universal stress protein E